MVFHLHNQTSLPISKHFDHLIVVIFLFITLNICFGSTVSQWYSACFETMGPRVLVSPSSLCCVLVQATFILA